MATNKEAALRKRQQIDSSKRSMFIAVAVTAFVSGVALVVAYFLIQQMIFHGRVSAEKGATLKTIRQNIKNIDDLKDGIRALDANQALNSVKAKEDNSALQSILDALPSEPNADALGASLQVSFAGSVDGLRVDSLTVDSVNSYQNSSDNQASASGTGDINAIGFTMSVSGSAEGLKTLLTRFEKSIRVIELTSIEIQAGSNDLQMKLIGRAYYEPGRVVQLGEKVVKP